MQVQASKVTNFCGKELDLHFISRLVLIRVWPDGKYYLITCVGGDVLPYNSQPLRKGEEVGVYMIVDASG